MARPLPALPRDPFHTLEDIYSRPSAFFAAPYATTINDPKTTLRGGTILHKGFYDLLSMIPTPSPSRLLWGSPPAQSDPVVAGPRYDQISLVAPPPTVIQTPIPPSAPTASPPPASIWTKRSQNLTEHLEGSVRHATSDI